MLLYYLQAATYKAQGNLSEAVKELNKILELNSGDLKVWIELAEIYIRLSQYEVCWISTR